MIVGSAPAGVLDDPHGGVAPSYGSGPREPGPREPWPAPRAAAPAPRRRTARDARSIAAPALLAIAILAFFAASMTMVTGAADGAAHPHGVHPGPVAADYAAIGTAPAVRPAPRPGPAASTGSFTAHCGRNAEGHRNAGNFITAPGRRRRRAPRPRLRRQHLDRRQLDRRLAGRRRHDLRGRPVDLLLAGAARHPPHRRGRRPARAAASTATSATSSPRTTSRSTSSATRGRGPAHARLPAHRHRRRQGRHATDPTRPTPARGWTCSGSPGRASATHYPLCPGGQLVRRTGEFPSCWNGVATDSGDHRTHVTFPDPATGACADRHRADPAAAHHGRATDVPPGRSFAVDSFPAQQRKAVTDHFDFENLVPEPLMRHVVECINAGRTC